MRVVMRAALLATALCVIACGRSAFEALDTVPSPSATPTPVPFCDSGNLGLVACYQFEGTAGDASAYGNDPTLAASNLQFSAGVHGLALHSTAGTFLRVPDSPSLNLTTAMTFEAWIRVDAMPGAGARFGMLDNDGQYGFFIHPGGQVRISCGAGATLDSALRIGEWTHIAAQWDGATVRIFRNGLATTGSATFAGVLGTGDNLGTALAGNSPSGDTLIGAIDDLRLWRVALPSSQIFVDAQP